MKRVIRWIGIGLGCVIGILVLVLAVVYGISQSHLTREYEIAAAAPPIRDDSATLAHGQHVAITRGCVDCHGANLGGGSFIDVPIFAILNASNLTSGQGGVAASYTDADWARAIRDGVGPDGKPLLFMPAQDFHGLSDPDLGALISYIEHLTPVDNMQGPNHVGPLGRLLFLAGKFPLVPAELIDHDAPRPPTPVPGPTAAYGAYLATTCAGCHGEGFSGGPIPGTPPSWPPASNITPDTVTGIGKWTEADFTKALRTGTKPNGSTLDPHMPWRDLRMLTDDEIHALWLYFRTVPPRGYGNG